MDSQQEKYNELSYYTLGLQDPYFIHQHVVDAFAAQTATKDTKPIKIAFALIGLYLYLEKGFTGKQVQNAHVELSKKRKSWPKFELPKSRGEITVADVLKEEPGKERDRKIREWCISVWEPYKGSRGKVAELLKDYLI